MNKVEESIKILEKYSNCLLDEINKKEKEAINIVLEKLKYYQDIQDAYNDAEDEIERLELEIHAKDDIINTSIPKKKIEDKINEIYSKIENGKKKFYKISVLQELLEENKTLK